MDNAVSMISLDIEIERLRKKEVNLPTLWVSEQLPDEDKLHFLAAEHIFWQGGTSKADQAVIWSPVPNLHAPYSGIQIHIDNRCQFVESHVSSMVDAFCSGTPFATKEGRALVIGSCTGFLADHLVRSRGFSSVTEIEWDQTLSLIARKIFPQWNLPDSLEKRRIIYGDARQMKLQDRSDLVFLDIAPCDFRKEGDYRVMLYSILNHMKEKGCLVATTGHEDWKEVRPSVLKEFFPRNASFYVQDDFVYFRGQPS